MAVRRNSERVAAAAALAQKLSDMQQQIDGIVKRMDTLEHQFRGIVEAFKLRDQQRALTLELDQGMPGVAAFPV